MTSPAPPPTPARPPTPVTPPGPNWPVIAPAQPRRATRSVDEALIGGVASGLAQHLGVSTKWVRLGFVVSGLVSGIGVALYAVLWVVLPTNERFTTSTPGGEAATRQGRLPGVAKGARADTGFLVAFGSLVVGGALLVGVLTGNSAVVWPLVLLIVSASILWRQADLAARDRWLDPTANRGVLGTLVGAGGWASYARLLVGLVLLAAAIIFFTVPGGQIGAAREVVIATVLAVAGVAIMLGPWLARLSSDLTAERAERIRVQERADMAAHLHDSVLQTLALIQRSADDPAAVAKLARGQERDLRSWLYAGAAHSAVDLRAGLETAIAEVEDTFAVAIELVVVGSPAYSEPLVAAAREAMINAARHSGVGNVDVFAETDESGTAVFVRDRGVGFDPAQVAADRRGLSHSIIDRMKRHGGSAQVRTSPGEGTEIRLRIPNVVEES